MYQRKILESLQRWKLKPHRKPLILRGARQVGKTTVVEMFAKEFDVYINLNLDKKSDKALFNQIQDVHSLLDVLLLREKKKYEKGRQLLLFIDEIQSSDAAVNMLRYFYEEMPEVYVIAAGSLLETLLNTHLSFPVGRVEYMVLRPFSFEEYLMAMNHESALTLIDQITFPDHFHDVLLTLFNKYCLSGGMPEIVRIIIETNSIVNAGEIFESLITSYSDDVEKYAKNEEDARVIRHCIDASLRLAGERIKFEGFGGGKYKSKDIGDALRTLEKTMLISLVYPNETTQLPLLSNKRKSPRLQLLDTGMLNYFAGIQAQILQNQVIDSVFEGKTAEHIVGQELLSLNPAPLYQNHFWVRDKRQSDAEVDFLVQHEGLLIPVEVKAGKAGKLRSLLEFADASPHHFAVRVYSGKFSIDKVKTFRGKDIILMNLPFYLVCRIHNYLDFLLGAAEKV